jgi:hypothetical protein
MSWEAPQSSGGRPAREAPFSRKEELNPCKENSQMEMKTNQDYPLFKRLVVVWVIHRYKAKNSRIGGAIRRQGSSKID